MSTGKCFKMKKAARILTAALVIVLAAVCFAFADEIPSSDMSAEGFSNNSRVLDSSRTTWATAYDSNCVYVSCDSGVDAVYVEFDRLPPDGWTVTDDDKGTTVQCGLYTFLHDYANLKELFGYSPKNISIEFAEDSVVADVYAYSGWIPDDVQKWQPYLDKADIVLLTTHSDDEQLFFAGIMPYYAIERKLDFQVVYFIQHFSGINGQGQDHVRPHEQLDGLWTVGIKHYPYISEFPDCYAESKNRQTALKNIQTVFARVGYSYDDFLEYTVSIIRRFKPQVLISHDLNGEYGHGAHVLNADTCTKAVEISGDPSEFPESAQAYGTWTVKKLYLHLYDEESIVMDWDTPYESMDGYTPFEMTQQGWMCHKSQHYAWFYRWLLGTSSSPIEKATQISTYSPCEFGLYFRTVGPDIYKNDMFENLVSYAQQEELLKADAAALSSEAKAREEELSVKLQEEEKLKKAAEEADKARLIEEEEKRESDARKKTIIGCTAGFVVIAVLIRILNKKKKPRRRPS